MTAFVTELLHPGLPNPRTDLSNKLVGELEDLVRDVGALQPSRQRDRDLLKTQTLRLSCFPKAKGRIVQFLLNGEMFYVVGPHVEFADAIWRDEDQRLMAFADRMLATPTGDSDETCHECREGDELGKKWTCSCASKTVKVDLTPWNYTVPIINNNCYSFAMNVRWCRSMLAGSHPGGPVPHTEEEVFNGLDTDRVVPATLTQVLNKRGHYLALFTQNDAHYHFLRLDGDFWTHKWMGFIPSACDERRKPIPKDAAEDAVFEGYFFKGYYVVPAGVRLEHCR